MNTQSIQKSIHENKVAKGFNVTDIPLEFAYLYSEVGEAFEAWRKNHPLLGSYGETRKRGSRRRARGCGYLLALNGRNPRVGSRNRDREKDGEKYKARLGTPGWCKCPSEWGIVAIREEEV